VDVAPMSLAGIRNPQQWRTSHFVKSNAASGFVRPLASQLNAHHGNVVSVYEHFIRAGISRHLP
jgi:hypothetical protein